MAHYAFIKDGIVTDVIVGIDEDNTEELPEGFSSWEEFYLSTRPGQDACKRTSYNTLYNEHLDGGTAFRGNYAGIGYIYDEANDVFYIPDPSEGDETYTFNTSTWSWDLDT
tara:strand:+ start:922 stop:1254 length:333 start_codon:yes stop_codon:yes gene_type:complete